MYHVCTYVRLHVCLCVQESVFDTAHSFEVDECGEVESFSEHAIMLIPFYFTPLIILIVLLLLVVLIKLFYYFRLATAVISRVLVINLYSYRRKYIDGQVSSVNPAANLQREAIQHTTPMKSYVVELDEKNETAALVMVPV